MMELQIGDVKIVYVKQCIYLFKSKIIYLNKIRVEELCIALRAQQAWKTSWKHIGITVL